MATRAAAIPSWPGTGPLIDVLIVLGASALAFLVEEQANARGLIRVSDVARGVSAVIGGALTALAVVRVRGGSLADLGFTRPSRWSTVPFWVAGMIVAFVAAQVLAPVLVAQFVTLPEPDLSRYDSIAGNLPAAVVLALILPLTASIPEEIIYRGFLIGRLEHLFGTGAGSASLAVIVQALVFGAVHFQWGLGGMLVTVIMGLVWGAGFLLCGRNLWIVILAHSAGHMLGVLQLYLSKSIII
jgi:membrane protease YdiL (CAAX protease family)